MKRRTDRGDVMLPFKTSEKPGGGVLNSLEAGELLWADAREERVTVVPVQRRQVHELLFPSLGVKGWILEMDGWNLLLLITSCD